MAGKIESIIQRERKGKVVAVEAVFDLDAMWDVIAPAVKKIRGEHGYGAIEMARHTSEQHVVGTPEDTQLRRFQFTGQLIKNGHVSELIHTIAEIQAQSTEVS